MANEKTDRTLAIFFRAFRGEKLNVQELANEYEVSTKSIKRCISEIRNFIADNQELVGNTELVYNRADNAYYFQYDEFLKDSEMLALIKILIGSRALTREEMLTIISKLKNFSAPKDREMLESLISKEKYHYCEVKHDCDKVCDMLWKIANDIRTKTEITIDYFKMNRDRVTRKIHPLSIMFSEYYFYLIAYKADDQTHQPVYFRIDRIKEVTEHRTHFEVESKYDFDEGALRKKIQFMFPGKCRKIRFEFSGPSLQAVLDKLPTAVVLETDGRRSLIEAEVYGTGIMMYLLSQGSWVKVLAPDDFVEEYKAEIKKMCGMYE